MNGLTKKGTIKVIYRRNTNFVDYARNIELLRGNCGACVL